MTNLIDRMRIERKALELVNEVARERGYGTMEIDPKTFHDHEALCRAIEQHEALIAENERKDAENERLREKLIGIRAEIDDMENPFNGDGNPEMRQGFEVAVDQAFNIVTAALEGGE